MDKFRKILSMVLSIVLISSAFLSNAGKVEASSSNVTALDIPGLNKEIIPLSGTTSKHTLLNVSSNGKFVVTSEYVSSEKGYKIYLHNTETGTYKHFDTISAFTNAFSLNGEVFVYGNGPTVKMAILTGSSPVVKTIASTKGSSGSMIYDDVMPNVSGDKIAYYTKSSIKVYDARNSTTSTITGYNGKVVSNSYNWSSDGDLYFWSHSNDTINLYFWNGSTTTKIGSYTSNEKYAYSEKVVIVLDNHVYLVPGSNTDPEIIKLDIEDGNIERIKVPDFASTPQGISYNGMVLYDGGAILNINTGSTFILSQKGKYSFVMDKAGKSIFLPEMGMKNIYKIDIDHLFELFEAPMDKVSGFAYHIDNPKSSNIQLSWEPVPNASGYKIYRDGELIKDWDVTSLYGRAMYREIGYVDSVPWGKLSTYEIKAYNNGGESEGAKFQIERPSNEAVIGNKTAAHGQILTLGGVDWLVIGDNLLFSTIPASTYMPFDKSSSSNGKYNTRSGTNVGKVLDDWLKSALNDQEMSYLDNSSMVVKNREGVDQYVDRSRIRLITLEEYENLKYSKLLYNQSTWTMTPGSARDTIVYLKDNYGSTEIGQRHIRLEGAGAFGVIKLKQGVQIEGSGTELDPYWVSGYSESPTLEAPQNVIGVAESDTAVSISWNPVENATSYEVTRNGVSAGTVTGVVFKDTGLEASTAYEYEIKAVAGDVKSPGTKVTVTTKEPKPVVGLVTDLKGEATSSKEVTLTWTAVEGADGYQIKRDGQVIGDITEATFKDMNAIPSTTHVYEVAGREGAEVGEFAKVAVTTKEEVKTDSPANFRASSIKSDKVTLKWDFQEGATFTIKKDGKVVYEGTDNIFVDADVVPEDSYSYSITATIAGVTSSAATIIVETPAAGETPILTVPQNLKAEATSPVTVDVTWTAVAGADGYQIKRDGVVVADITDTKYTDSTAVAGTTYEYEVSARAGGTIGEFAKTSVTTPEEVQLEAPANLRVIGQTHNSIHIAWDQVQGASEYVVSDANGILHQGPETQFTAQGLAPDMEYTFTVRAVGGPESSVTGRTTSETIPYPSNLSVISVTYEEVGLIWDPVLEADSYTILRDGIPLETVSETLYVDKTVSENTDYIYSVIAKKGAVESKPAVKHVKTPSKPIEGKEPEMPTGLKVTRAYADKVKMHWNTSSDATHYEVYRDGSTLVYKGHLTAFTDDTTGPEQTYTYTVVAVNDYGKTSGDTISVTTPEEPVSIVITPTPPSAGTITFKFNVIEGAYEYYVNRNPEWKYVDNGDGTYKVTYVNEVTGETKDYGNVAPVDGKLPFMEDNVDPGKNYHYDITAVRMGADGTPEVIAEIPVDVTTPSDGSGGTVPGETEEPTENNPSDGGNDSATDTETGESTTNTSETEGNVDPNGGNSNSGSGTNTNTGGDYSTGGSTNSTSGGAIAPNNDNNKDKEKEESGKDDKNPPVVDGGDKDKEEVKVDFTDVEGNFAEKEIVELAKQGILIGYKDGTFAPNREITRAEFAVILTRAMGYTSDEGYKHSFEDFNPGAWYAKELAIALNNGVTKGFDEKTYRPNINIPREQAAVMISNILKKKFNEKVDVAKFKDSDDIVGWAKESVNLATEKGIINGYPNGTFLPKANVTRAEVAKMVYKLIEAMK